MSSHARQRLIRLIPNLFGAVSATEGQWVTSKDRSTRYYAPKNSNYWQTWVESNRVWFRTLEDLLRAFPNRERAPS